MSYAACYRVPVGFHVRPRAPKTPQDLTLASDGAVSTVLQPAVQCVKEKVLNARDSWGHQVVVGVARVTP